MTRIVIDKENEITKLENMLETLTDEKDKQSVRFAINIISGFNEVLSERPQGDIRWTDKLSVKSNGDIIDFEGRVVGHINLEDMKGGAENGY